MKYWLSFKDTETYTHRDSNIQSNIHETHADTQTVSPFPSLSVILCLLSHGTISGLFVISFVITLSLKSMSVSVLVSQQFEFQYVIICSLLFLFKRKCVLNNFFWMNNLNSVLPWQLSTKIDLMKEKQFSFLDRNEIAEVFFNV